MKLVSIIIPFYNESEGLSNLLAELVIYYEKTKLDFEVLLIDDGSTDDSIEKIMNYSKLPFECKIIILSKNYGSHAAIKAGFLNSSGEFSVYFPADLQIPLKTIDLMHEVAESGYDIVSGIRTVNNVGIFEKFFSRIYSGLMRKYVISSFPNEGLETLFINRKVRNIMNNNIEANSSFALQILSLGFKNKFLSINKTSRKQGVSKWTLSKKLKLLIDSFIAFSYAPIRFVTLMGMILFFIGFCFTTYLIGRKILIDDLDSGWPMLISIITIGFGITNISLGIIAEYLWRTLDASRKRPVFIIDDIIELKKE